MDLRAARPVYRCLLQLPIAAARYLSPHISGLQLHLPTVMDERAVSAQAEVQ